MLLFLTNLGAAEGGGFNPLELTQLGNALWTWVIFLGALPIIWKVVMGPITSALEERDEHVQRSIAAAEKASSEAEAARAQVEIRLGEAQAAAAKLLAEARERAEVREREILENAKQEAATMVDAARTSIRAEEDKALDAIRKEVVDLSLTAATRVLGRNVGSEDDRRFVAGLITGAGTKS